MLSRDYLLLRLRNIERPLLHHSTLPPADSGDPDFSQSTLRFGKKRSQTVAHESEPRRFGQLGFHTRHSPGGGGWPPCLKISSAQPPGLGTRFSMEKGAVGLRLAKFSHFCPGGSNRVSTSSIKKRRELGPLCTVQTVCNVSTVCTQCRGECVCVS